MKLGGNDLIYIHLSLSVPEIDLEFSSSSKLQCFRLQFSGKYMAAKSRRFVNYMILSIQSPHLRQKCPTYGLYAARVLR